MSPSLRRFLEQTLRQNHELKTKLEQIEQVHEQLRAQHEALTAPAYRPTVITNVYPNGKAIAEIFDRGSFSEVAVHPEIAQDRLKIGAKGRVSQTGNCLLDVHDEAPAWSEIGTFDSLSEQGDLLLEYQGGLKKIRPVHGFPAGTLKKGDQVGFDPDARLAFARVEPRRHDELFLEATPNDRFEDLAGLDSEIGRIKRLVRLRLDHPELARSYRLPTGLGMLFHGPPGVGKTKLARAVANHIAVLSADGVCRFMAISGSADYSMWLGRSEERIRARFAAVRQVALVDCVPIVMFWDEIDAIGRRRGSSFGSDAPDRILNTFLSELSEIAQLPGVFVIAATNRPDVLDPGLTRSGRLGDEVILIPAPGRFGAKEILIRYLRDLPLRDPLESMVEPVLSRIYSANGEYAELTRVLLRDGRRLAIGGRDLVSGALLENVVRKAAETAAFRQVDSGAGGIVLDDLSAALDQALLQAAGLLSVSNVRSYVPRLPQDVDPVAVEPVARTASLGIYVRGG
jgi:ATP-dependent 26S proteasome regulatory subunit